MAGYLLKHGHLPLEKHPRGVRYNLWNADNGGVHAMAVSERVVHIDIAEAREALCERRAVFNLSFHKSDILKHQNASF